MLARRFLGCVFVLILLAVGGALLVFQFGQRALISQAAPKGHYQTPPDADSPDYAQATNWLSRPGGEDDPALWLPEGETLSLEPTSASVFYVHPTTYLERDRWNAPLRPGGAAEANLRLFARSQSSIFNQTAEIWAPRYRQAAFGAFLLRSEDARRALALAHGDVRRAFDAFLAAIPTDRPIILAGHSQGALHLLRLLAERRDALKGRLVVAYVGGWPVGRTSDLPATGLKPCSTPTQTGCVMSWQSFGEPANTGLVDDAWLGSAGLTGRKRTLDDMICTNPLTGGVPRRAEPGANPGTLVPSGDFATATLKPGLVGAQCRGGFLIIDGAIPPLGPFVLPGNNYHVYDYALFWKALRDDVARRRAAFR